MKKSRIYMQVAGLLKYLLCTAWSPHFKNQHPPPPVTGIDFPDQKVRETGSAGGLIPTFTVWVYIHSLHVLSVLCFPGVLPTAHRYVLGVIVTFGEHWSGGVRISTRVPCRVPCALWAVFTNIIKLSLASSCVTSQQ